MREATWWLGNESFYFLDFRFSLSKKASDCTCKFECGIFYSRACDEAPVKFLCSVYDLILEKQKSSSKTTSNVTFSECFRGGWGLFVCFSCLFSCLFSFPFQNLTFCFHILRSIISFKHQETYVSIWFTLFVWHWDKKDLFLLTFHYILHNAAGRTCFLRPGISVFVKVRSLQAPGAMAPTAYKSPR